MNDVDVKYEPTTNKVLFEFKASNQLDFVEKMSSIGEITSNRVCKYKKKDGKICNSNDTRYLVRDIDDNQYYEMKCNTCGATFQFGRHKKSNTLFPKIGEGWKKFNPETNQREDGI